VNRTKLADLIGTLRLNFNGGHGTAVLMPLIIDAFQAILEDAPEQTFVTSRRARAQRPSRELETLWREQASQLLDNLGSIETRHGISHYAKREAMIATITTLLRSRWSTED
jgi:hypothetical protein